MSKIKSNIKDFWQSVPKFLRVIFWILFILVILPSLFILLLAFTRYGNPSSDTLSLAGKQILTHHDNKLYLYEFQSKDVCRKIKSNDSEYVKTSGSNCARVTKVSDLLDNYTSTVNKYGHDVKNNDDYMGEKFDVNGEKKPVIAQGRSLRNGPPQSLLAI